MAMPDKQRHLPDVPPLLRQKIRECTSGVAPWPLFVFGPPGTGKTCGALCLVDRVSRALFWTEESLCDYVTDALMGRLVNRLGHDITPRQIWYKVNDSPLVVVDEIGSRTAVSDHRYTTIKNLLDAREGKALMLVSNVAPKDIAQIYDARIASRALNGTIVEVGGADRRLAK